ncbi:MULTISPECIES: UDP-N-acetylmuramate--L-alanine ligase [unclassified Nitratiruptor]|uniref:UDP-N-acetylmuramate--L-alanine ligase n=1 Tax=unclassified Nitratiruptor TaxID=2624044 RepID=UPI00191623EC|nr:MULTISPECIES: UDP-N-acetylmuramate--L-alanine ligase [unclassified Nitratiruptor]BCD60580.1 UDP-N-acetylmuramate--alanine ligase [Nitratiruptor sp. YY08-10]BCD64511.1 UDP-N-acetylmuramate--alanine ligase [Nitratiruptor sp. YY08-14]
MKIHFIGIGGIGLSGLARFLQYEGYRVSGSDMSETPLVQKLREEGITVDVPQKRENITSDIDVVIYSAAVKSKNPELQAAKSLGIKTIPRREALPIVLGGKKVYAVAGAHGKSTTSAILASILNEASAIIGAESKEFGSNVRYTGSETVVFEADESDASFLNSNPYCAIVTNAEPEHMEYYNHDLELFYDAYRSFLKQAKVRVINAEDPFLASLDLEAIRLYPSQDIKNITHFLKDDEPHIRFELRDFGAFEVWGFGKHIAIDASLAILAAMRELGLDEIKKNLQNYKGIKKRFDIVEKREDLIVIDDYAHHPTEIKATLASLLEYARLKNIKDITIIWQPHKYSRVLDNLEEFVRCFHKGAKLVILPVWSAGEDPVEIDFENLFKEYAPLFADRIKKDGKSVWLIKDKKALESIEKGLVIGFGAGDITYQLRGLR